MRNNITSTVIKIDRVSHGYGTTKVLHNFTLNVNRNEFVVLVGPSGCGKTTLLNILSGFITPISGSVYTSGTSRTVYQQDGLFPWLTVSENICMGLRQIKKSLLRNHKLDELVDLVHLKDFRDHYPHQLSGGMRQRVELARVLAGDADILLMDEPFSSLDYITRIQMRQELIRMLNKKPMTVLYVTHDIEEAVQLADRVIVLSERPATICRELGIDAARPRNLTDSIVVAAARTIFCELGLQVKTVTNVNDHQNDKVLDINGR